MITFPNAKINLGLNIVEKRSDGFHNLETVFYPIPWQDALEIMPSDKFEFNSSGISIDGQSDNNLCVKVYEKLKVDYNLPPVKMHLHKNIPIGAGLGGGSSDAAFTVKLLKSIFDLPLTENQMEEMVRPLGSDCAFFIRNKPVFASGKGDQFEPIELSLKGKWIALINPNVHISTKEAYAGIKPTKPANSIKEIIKSDIKDWKNHLKNDFEESIFPNYPALKSIKESIYDAGALYACMSGSGSTLFGIFESEINTQLWTSKHFKVQAGKLE